MKDKRSPQPSPRIQGSVRVKSGSIESDSKVLNGLQTQPKVTLLVKYELKRRELSNSDCKLDDLRSGSIMIDIPPLFVVWVEIVTFL